LSCTMMRNSAVAAARRLLATAAPVRGNHYLKASHRASPRPVRTYGTHRQDATACLPQFLSCTMMRNSAVAAARRLLATAAPVREIHLVTVAHRGALRGDESFAGIGASRQQLQEQEGRRIVEACPGVLWGGARAESRVGPCNSRFVHSFFRWERPVMKAVETKSVRRRHLKCDQGDDVHTSE